MRLFVAFELPRDVRDELGRISDRLARTGADVRWVRPDAMHVTLKFLGEVEASRLAEITAALATVACPPFALRVEGLGHFPPRGRARVLWAGLTGEVDAAIALAARIDDAMADLSFVRESRPFRPHVTLGRVRSPRGLDDLLAELARTADRVRCEMPPIDEFVLFESQLEPAGPRYDARWRSSIRDSNEA